MGGSKKGKARKLLNILIVFALSGLARSKLDLSYMGSVCGNLGLHGKHI